MNEYMQNKIDELTKCADPVTGPEYFMQNHYYVQHPVKGKILLEPRKEQKERVLTMHAFRNSIDKSERQTGKSATAAAYMLWSAMFNPDMRIFVGSYNFNGMLDIMYRVQYGYENCAEYLKAGLTRKTKTVLEFENGSKIMGGAITESALRGMSLDMLYLDDFAFTKENVADDFWVSAYPIVALGTKVIISSTENPRGHRVFDQLWTDANTVKNKELTGINGFRAYEMR